MKNKFILLTIIPLLIAGCSSSEESGNTSSTSGTSNTSSTSIEPPIDPTGYIEDISSIQDTTILHAWNWKLNDIKSRLQQIKDAGYNSIQISPMQPKVDKTNYATQSTKSQWWKYYQPLEFKVAENNETILGTKEELTSLCSKAKELGISIVVDIVANHLSGSNGVYNGQVYTQYPLHSYNGNTDDASCQATVHGRVGGLPDVDTSNSTVQNKIADMLCEYLECGIKGFRFDTAKHIETPDDGEYASNFWPFVLGKADSYAESHNLNKPYYYGEILNTCGTGRSYNSYNKYMSFTDNKSGQNVLNAVKSSSITTSTLNYPTEQDATHLVLWAESHDTYANDEKETTDVSQEKINKAFVIQGSRKDAASLYFARPSGWNATLGSIYEDGWIDNEIKAINYFHSIYNKKSEQISVNDGVFVNVRGEDEYAGAAIVSMQNASSKSLTISSLQDGEYVNLVNNEKVSVSNGQFTVSLVNDSAVIVPTSLDPKIPQESSDSYTSSIVIKNSDTNKKYFLWNWTNSGDGHWVSFVSDHDAIGSTINTNSNYIIVEANKDTTNMDWSKAIRQTNDLYYDGSQKIYEFSNIVWKS